MEVSETVVEWAAESAPEADPAWFAIRQPGILKYVETRCGAWSALCGVALHAAFAMHAAFERSLGTPPPRVASSLLTRAEKAVLAEADMNEPPVDGIAERQPFLAGFVASVAAGPPVPLSADERVRLGLTLLTVLYALDDAATGRPVP